MSGELVGPLTRLWFNNDQSRAYDLPKHSLDLRYEACPAHHPACDCREAIIAEIHAEYRDESRRIAAAFDDVLDGHLTRTWPGQVPCMCTGCQVARRLGFRHAASRAVREAAATAAARHEWIPF